jgi:hypothetical protein
LIPDLKRHKEHMLSVPFFVYPVTSDACNPLL